MLVLTRKVKEQIVIGDNITITLVRMQGNSVRIGIDAPKDVRVIRGELQPIEPAPELHDEAEELNEGVFAHPQPTPAGRNRLSSSSHVRSQSSSSSDPQLFVGQVGRDGEKPTLRRTTLADFMSAT